MIAAVIELEEHQPRCACLMCGARRWLRYIPEEDQYPNSIDPKIATYGGMGAGGGEPDHFLDRWITEHDFRRALALIPSEWLRKVGQTWMETPYPPSTKRGPRTRREAVMGKLNVDQHSLDRLIDDCCREMALVMGERHLGQPYKSRLSILAAEEPDPVRGVTYR